MAEAGMVRRTLAVVGLARPEITSLGLQASADGTATGSNGSSTGTNGGYWVPADTTWSQILDYASGAGDPWPFDFYRAGLPIGRDVAVSYATLNRCVTLIAGTVAQLVAGGSLRVVDRDGRRRTSRRTRRVLDLLSESADGGTTPAASFVEDLVADYCLDGNALVVPSVSGDGTLQRLRRMSPWDNDVQYARTGQAVYRLTTVDGPPATEYHAARDVVHVRWPRLLRYGRTRSTREGFALAPVVALRPALDIGLQGDTYIREWFRRGAQSRLHINYDTPQGAQPLVLSERQKLVEWVQRYSRTRAPLVTFDGKSSYLQDTPQDREAKELREFQVHEVARVFGVPAPLLNVDITNWGSGIEQLAKLYFRFGARQHLDRVLAALGVRLLPPGDRFWVDTSDLLRGDSEAISKLLTPLQGDAQRDPIATREELRHLAGLPRDIDGEFPARRAPAPPGPQPPGVEPAGLVSARESGGAVMSASEFQAARRKLGLTIEALAERLRVDPRTLRRWQSGDRKVPSEAAEMLRSFLRDSPPARA